MAFPDPSVPVVDNFNRADGAIGANWSLTFSGAVQFTVASNQAAPDAAGGGTSAWHTSQSGHHQIYVTLSVNDTTAGAEYGLDYCMSNMNSGAENGYRVETNAGKIELLRVDARVFTQLGAQITQAKATNDQIVIDLNGGTHTIAYNGVSIGTRSDSTYTSGFPGMFSNASSTQRLDNFGTGTVTATPVSGYQQDIGVFVALHD